MKAHVKPEHAPVHAQEPSVVPQFSEWVKQGTENFFAAQRILLDLVMRQNALAIDALRERLTAKGPRPGAVLSEVAGEGFAGFIAAQKVFLNLAQKQNEIVVLGIKERIGASTPAAAMTDLLRRGVDTFIDLQQHFLDVAEKQTTAWLEAAKTGKPYSGKDLVQLVREGFDDVARRQKDFLDAIAEETTKAAKGIKEHEKAAKKTPLAELARQSGEAFIEAQKKLLETATEKIEFKVPGLVPDTGTSLATFTRQSVENFVAAQKALLDVMVNPVAQAKGTHEKKHPEKEHAELAHTR